MAYDTATIHILRSVLDEILSSPSFIRQQYRSAADIAQRVLWLASQGQLEPESIKRHLLSEFLPRPLPNTADEPPLRVMRKTPK